MGELSDVLYPINCWNAWREGDEYAAVELVRGLCSPNLIVRIITRVLLKDSPLQTLLTTKPRNANRRH
jgi:hypothetical protein